MIALHFEYIDIVLLVIIQLSCGTVSMAIAPSITSLLLKEQTSLNTRDIRKIQIEIRKRLMKILLEK